jgi:mannose/cellobiose epimerase-like protein (N-acyl-D-glucosamine 2-epimerase family)
VSGKTKISLVGKRPFFAIGPLGSRNAALMAFLTDAGIYVRAGCFWNTLEAFKAAVAKTHGTSDYGVEYQNAITMIEWHAHFWTPKAEKAA